MSWFDGEFRQDKNTENERKKLSQKFQRIDIKKKRMLKYYTRTL